MKVSVGSFLRKDKNHEKKEEKSSLKEKQQELTSEQKKALLSAAYILSRKYSYLELMQAADKDTAKIKGREVHGYMQRMFHNYDWLCENDVFDYAVDFAKKYYRPDIFNVVKHYDFENAIINVIYLPKNTHFDHFPNFDFSKIIVLTQEEPFENCVHWIENEPWENEAGYMTTKTLAPCNFLSLGFTLWDLPVTVLKDAVGMDKLFFEARTTADNITKMRDQILKKHIYTKRQEENTTNEKLLEMEIRYEQLEERHQYLIDDIRAGDTRNPEEKLRDWAKRYDRKVYIRNIDWKKITYGIIAIIILILAIIFIQLLFPPPPSSSELPKEAGMFISNLFKRRC